MNKPNGNRPVDTDNKLMVAKGVGAGNEKINKRTCSLVERFTVCLLH